MGLLVLGTIESRSREDPKDQRIFHRKSSWCLPFCQVVYITGYSASEKTPLDFAKFPINSLGMAKAMEFVSESLCVFDYLDGPDDDLAVGHSCES